MYKTLLPLFLCGLLLSGCGPGPVQEAQLPDTQAAVLQLHPGYYDPQNPLEQSTGGAVQCFPLTDLITTDAMALGENILVFTSAADSTMLTLLSGPLLQPDASLELDTKLTPGSYSLHVFEGGLSFYDDSVCQTLVLDACLREVQRIPAPEGLMGHPILSGDCRSLFYCTADSVRVLDLETGISRCLRESTYSFQRLEGLWLADSVLECSIVSSGSEQKLFLSAQNGQLLGIAQGNFSFQASGDTFYASHWEGNVRQMLFGSADAPVQALNPPGDVQEICFLPDIKGAVTLSETVSGNVCLEYYNLQNGFLSSRLELSEEHLPQNFFTLPDGRLCFLRYDPTLNCFTLCKWDIRQTLTGEDTVYTGPYYTRQNPDLEALEECARYAGQIGEKYGIEVLVYRQAAETEPWDYDLEYEHLPGVLNRELELLDAHLANYPEGFLSSLASRYEGLKICIVRSITGTPESGSLKSADGIQFLSGYTACLALAAGANTEYALYHELCHLIDTVVITESGAYDRWEELNPDGFSYDYDYAANATRNSSAYLQDSSRCFIDNYSMSYPKEDRARIMEYAMTSGNEAYFRSPVMQAKLKLLCEGIREAFGLKKSPQTYLWEQYLQVSLAYPR